MNSQYLNYRVGQTVKLANSVAAMSVGALLSFPSGSLTFDKISIWKIDDVDIEDFKFTDHRYRMLYDSNLESTYFMNLIKKTSITREEPEFVKANKFVFENFEYEDISGLIETRIDGKSALFKVFSRPLTGDETEYLFVIVDDDIIRYYVGVEIVSLQLK